MDFLRQSFTSKPNSSDSNKWPYGKPSAGTTDPEPRLLKETLRAPAQGHGQQPRVMETTPSQYSRSAYGGNQDRSEMYDQQPEPRSKAPRQDGRLRKTRHQDEDDSYNTDDELDRMDGKIRSLKSQLKARDDTIVDLKQKETILMNEKIRVGSEKDKLARDFRQLQENSFKSFEDARWQPLAASEMTAGLEDIQKIVGNIAKAFASDNFSTLGKATPDDQARFRAVLEPVFRFEEGGGWTRELAGIGQGPEWIRELASMKLAPRLCLTALISTDIHTVIFSDPFFFATDHGPRQQPSEARDAVMSNPFRDLYRTSAMAEVVKGNIWRSDTLRLVYPLHLEGTKEGQARIDHMARKIDAASELLAKQFDTRLLNAFLKFPENEGRNQFRQDLISVYTKAGRMSTKLWTQRPALECRYLWDLYNERFHFSSPMLEAHRLHRLDDPSDRRLDGRLPKVVVHPAVLMAGTHDAENYGSTVVLTKAVVWMGE